MPIVASDGPVEPAHSRARKYAERIFAAFEKGSDVGIVELHRELQADQDFYWAVWGYLPSGMRRQISEILEREKP